MNRTNAERLNSLRAYQRYFVEVSIWLADLMLNEGRRAQRRLLQQAFRENRKGAVGVVSPNRNHRSRPKGWPRPSIRS